MPRIPTVVATLLLIVSCATANDAELEKVRKSVIDNIPGIEAQDIRRSQATGLYEVRKGAAYGYVTADGKYLVQGDLIDLRTGESLTEQRRMEHRVAALKTLGSDKTIDFGPRDAKHTITIFTDIDCGYCRKLHREMADYNARGIAVRYLFYPRSGPGTPSFHKAEAVWCSADKQKALTEAKLGQDVKAANCKNPIQEHYDLGEQLGINATPMLILPDGELITGYLPPQVLSARLQNGRKSAKGQP